MPRIKWYIKKRMSFFRTLEGSMEIQADTVHDVLELKEKVGAMNVS